MFKWFRKKLKRRHQKSHIHSEHKPKKIYKYKRRLTDFEHVYEEIGEPSTRVPQRTRPVTMYPQPEKLSKKERATMIQRSISFHDMAGLTRDMIEMKLKPINDQNISRSANGSAASLASSVSSVSSVASQPPLYTGSSNLNFPVRRPEVSLQCMPDKILVPQGKPVAVNNNNEGETTPVMTSVDEGFVNAGLVREGSGRAGYLIRPTVVLPRRAATFGAADMNIAKKKVQFHNQTQEYEVYSANGSDSGYGYSTHGGSGSDESDTPSRTNYLEYLSKMQELLRLEKEVKHILKSIRGGDDDEPLPECYRKSSQISIIDDETDEESIPKSAFRRVKPKKPIEPPQPRVQMCNGIDDECELCANTKLTQKKPTRSNSCLERHTRPSSGHLCSTSTPHMFPDHAPDMKRYACDIDIDECEPTSAWKTITHVRRGSLTAPASATSSHPVNRQCTPPAQIASPTSTSELVCGECAKCNRRPVSQDKTAGTPVTLKRNGFTPCLVPLSSTSWHPHHDVFKSKANNNRILGDLIASNNDTYDRHMLSLL